MDVNNFIDSSSEMVFNTSASIDIVIARRCYKNEMSQ
jgi:hypothetical protein